jgi:NAD(P)-dependent dehydrogenase (short-subunit alcohol dehydrogenase family)
MTMIHDPSAAAAGLFGLAGKSVLVTGASLGIGQAVARMCSAAGASVIVTGRNEERLAETLDSLAPAPEGAPHKAIVAELTDAEQVKRVALECGPVDGVVHAAGIRGLSPMKLLAEAHLQEVMSTNFVAPMMLTRHLLARQALKPGGSVVLLSSIAALSGTVGVGPYSGSKAALIGTMRPLALELARRKARVNALAPGLVETTLTAHDRPWFDEQNKRYPLGTGVPDDVAYACLYLLSDASTAVTAAVFSMDGGLEFA